MIGLLEGGRPAPRRLPDRVILLKATIAGCTPPIWRRVAVRERMWLSRLHEVLQVLFDWYDYQTHSFQLAEVRYGNPLKRDELVIEDDRDVTLTDVKIPEIERFVYGYHFGEGWLVELTVEKAGPRVKGERYPRCLGGARAGPPEDCGGVEGYHSMLAALKGDDPELARKWREWLGPEYDPESFATDRLNQALGRLRRA